MDTISTGRKNGKQDESVHTLSAGQKIGSVAVGVSLWLVFVFVVRAIPWAFDGGLRSALLFLLTVPLTYSFVVFLKRGVSLTPQTVFEAVSLATFPALLLDGFVFTFLSEWYGSTETHARYGAGFIFWGAGMGMLIAWSMRSPKAPER